jgi:hypothetical protein
MAAPRVPGVLGSFEHIDSAVDAIHGLKRAGHDDVTVYSAAPNHEIEEALGTGSSWVRAFTLIGALTGCAAGYRDDDLDVVRLAAAGRRQADCRVSALHGHHVRARDPDGVPVHGSGDAAAATAQEDPRPCLPSRFSDDRIGIFVPCSSDRAEACEQLLSGAGAVEVSHEG